MTNTTSQADRFWSKVATAGADECWPWLAAKRDAKSGYGRFGVGRSKTVYAHRWSYENHYGSIPDGAYIDHVCRNQSCVNPQHLRAVTFKQNIENHNGPISTNTSGVRGVYFETGTQRWVAQVKSKNNPFFKRFNTREEAAEAVLEARRAMFTHNDIDRIGA